MYVEAVSIVCIPHVGFLLLGKLTEVFLILLSTADD